MEHILWFRQVHVNSSRLAIIIQNIIKAIFTIIYLRIDTDKIHPKVVIVKKGDNAEFKCSSDKKLKWTFNNKRVPDNAISHGSSLLISRVVLQNQGFYQCSGTVKKQHYIARAILKLKGEFACVLRHII